jgi:hypothetical protein
MRNRNHSRFFSSNADGTVESFRSSRGLVRQYGITPRYDSLARQLSYNVVRGHLDAQRPTRITGQIAAWIADVASRLYDGDDNRSGADT